MVRLNRRTIKQSKPYLFTTSISCIPIKSPFASHERGCNWYHLKGEVFSTPLPAVCDGTVNGASELPPTAM